MAGNLATATKNAGIRNSGATELDLARMPRRNSAEEEKFAKATLNAKVEKKDRSLLDKILNAADSEFVRSLEGLTTGGSGSGFGQFVGTDWKEQAEANQAAQQLRQKYGDNYAKFMQYTEEIRDAEARRKQQEEIRKAVNTGNKAKDIANSALYTGADILLSPMAGATAAAETLKKKTYADQNAPINTNSPLYTAANFGEDVEQGVSDRIDNPVGKFAYGTGVSMGKSGLAIAIGGATSGALGLSGNAAKAVAQAATLPMFGTSAYASTLEDMQNKGIDEKKAIATAAVAGMAEMATEVVSLDHFWDIAKSRGSKAAKNLLLDALVQAGIEGSEEVASEVINTIADNLINADKSEYNENVKKYGEKAAKEILAKNIGMAFAGGAVSGLAFGATGNVVKFLNDNADAKQAFDEGNYREFADSIDTDKKSYKNDKDLQIAINTKKEAERLADKQDNGEEITNKEKRALWNQIQDTMEVAIKDNNAQYSKEVYEAYGMPQSNTERTTENAQNNLENIEANNVTSTKNNAVNEASEPTVDTWEPKLKEFNAEDVPAEYRQSNISEAAAIDMMNKAQTAQELTDAYKAAEKTDNVERMYDLNSGRLQNSNKATEDEIHAMVSEPTKEEAYLMGANGQEAAQLSPEAQEAYNQGAIIRSNEIQKAKVTDNPIGAMAIDQNGQEVTIKGVDHVSNKDVTLKTDKGTIDLADAVFNNQATAKLYDETVNYNKPGAQIFLEAYPGTIPVNTYAQQMKRYYNAGELGLSFENTLDEYGYINRYVSEADLRKIYDAGKQEKEASKKKEKKLTTAKKAKGVYTDNRKDKSGKTVSKVLKQAANKMGVDIELADDLGERTNGYYAPEMAKIILNSDADILNTFFHESGEFLQAYAPEEYEDIAVSLLEFMRHQRGAEGFADLVDSYLKAYKEADDEQSRAEVARELANDMIAPLFMTDDGVEDYVNYLTEEYQGEAESIIDRITRFIQELIDEIKSFIDNHATLTRAQRETLNMEADKAAELRQRFFDAMDKAIENRDAALKPTVVIDGDNYAISENDETAKSKDGKTVDIIDLSTTRFNNRKGFTNAISATRNLLLGLRGDSVNISSDGREVFFDKRGAKEYTMSRSTMNSKTNEQNAKFNAANKIKDIVKRAENPRWEEDKDHRHGKIAQRGWTKYDVMFIAKDGDNYSPVKARLNVRMADDGKDYVYDIDKIKIEAAQTINSSPNMQPLVNNSITPESEKTSENTEKVQRNSVKVDSENRELSKGQQEYFKDSKIRDDEGRLIEVYHGTPYGGFTEFKNDLNYFTPNKEYADRYQNPSASSVRGKYDPATKEQTYAGYLNITKPFDISDPKTWDIFVNEYIEGGWSASIAPGTSIEEIKRITENGIDWTEADNLKEFFDEEGYDYDGLILDEGGDPDGNGGIYYRGKSYVTFNSNQFKNVDNLNPTKNPDIRYSIGGIDVTDIIENADTKEVKGTTYKADVFFNGTEGEIEEAERQQDKHKKAIARIINAPDFNAMEYDRERIEAKDKYGNPWRSYSIVSPAFREGYEWQLTHFDNYGPVSHAELKNKDDLIDRVNEETLGTNTKFKVVKDNKMSDRLNNKDKDLRFSLKTPVEETKDLIAIHNMTTDELKNSLALGGFPSPSIAIIKADMEHSKYGDTSILFDKDTIDPKKNSKNKVYGGDAWTPTFPSIAYKVDETRLKDAIKKIKGLAGDIDMFGYAGFDSDQVSSALESGRGSLNNTRYADQPIVKMAYLKDKGVDIEPVYKEKDLHNKISNEQLRKINERFIKPEYLDELASDYQYGSQHPEELAEIRDEINKIMAFDFEDLINKSMEKYEKTGKEVYKERAESFKNYFNEDNFRSYDLYEVAKALKNYREEGVSKVVDVYATRDKINDLMEGREEDYNKWIDDLYDGIIEKTGIYNGKDWYTPSGNRRSWEATHDPVTLDNIVKAMNKRDAKGDAFFSGMGIKAIATKDFKSIADIRKAKHQIREMDEEEYEKLLSEHATKFSAIISDIMPEKSDNEFIERERISDIIADTIRTKKTVGAIDQELRKWIPTVKSDTASRLVDLMTEISEMPYGYFEAKPQRAVRLDEVAKIILPDNADQDLISEIEAKGLPYETYKAGDEQDRKRVVNKNDNIRFSVKVDDAQKVGKDTVIPGIRYSYDPNEFMPTYDDFSLENMFDEDLGLKERTTEDLDDDAIGNVSKILSVANEALKGQSVDESIIKSMARDIKKTYQSNIKLWELEKNLKTFFEYMQDTDNINYRDMMNVLTQVAYPVIEQTGDVDPIAQEDYDRLLNYLKGKKIYLNDNQRSTVAYTYGSVKEFKKMLRGIVNITDDTSGARLDMIWDELNDASNGYAQNLKDERPGMGDGDLPIVLAETIDLMKPEVINSYGQDQKRAALDLSMDIIRRYYGSAVRKIEENASVEALKNGTKTRDALKTAKAQMAKEMTDYRKATKEEYETRLKEAEDQAAKAAAEGRYWRGIAMAADGNKEAIENERKNWKEKEAEYKRQLKQIAKQKAGKSKSLVEYLDKQNAAKEKAGIMKAGNRLMKMVVYPTDKNHMPEIVRKPIGEFLETIDFISHRARQDSKISAKWQERMRALADYLDSLGEMEDPNADMVLMVLDEDLIRDMRDFAKNRTQVSRMDAKQLHDLNSILSRLSAAVTKANETFANSRYETVDGMAQVSMNEIKSLKNTKEGNIIMTSAKDFFGKQLEDPVTYFESMGEAAGSIYQELLKGFDLRTAHIKEATEYMEDQTKNIKDMYKWSTQIIKAGDVEMTATQVMSLYELTKREQARKHLLTGGIKTETVMPGGKKVMSVDEIHLGYGKTMELINQLSKEQLDVADAMQKYMANECADWGNHTSMILYDYKKFNEPNYFPIRTDSKTRATNNKEAINTNQSLFANKNFSATKELTIGANNTIIISDIFDVFTDHVTQMATYDGMVLPQMDAMRWFNYTEVEVEAGEEADRKHYNSIRKEIQRTFGEAGNKYFTNLMLSINGMEPKARSAGFISTMIGRYKRTAVMAKIRVAIQQPTAYVRALDEIKGKYLSQAAANPVSAKKYSDKAKKNSMLAWWKGQGYYETYLGKDVRDMMVGKNPVAQKAEDFAGWGAQTMDDLTWGVLYHAVELEIKDTNKDLKYDSPEFTEKVVDRFEDVVSKTQVVDTMLHKTDIMRNNNELVKMATSFMAEPLKSYNMLLRSFNKLAQNPKDKKAIKRLERALAVYLFNNVVLTLVTATWDAFRKDDDETKFIDRWKEIFKKSFIDNVNPLNMIPIVKDAVDVASSKLSGEYYAATDMTYDGIGKVAKFVSDAGKRLSGEKVNKTDYGIFMEGAQSLSVVSGVPVYNVLNDMESIYNGLFENIERSQSTSDYAKLVKEINKDGDVTGEIKKLKDIGKEDKNIKSTITRNFKEDYLAITDKAEKADMKNKLIKAFVAAGDTREEAIEKINKWSEN